MAPLPCFTAREHCSLILCLSWLLLGAAADDDVTARRPKYFRVNRDIETVWQRPPGEPKGIFLIAHGCQHQATDIVSDVGPDGWRLQECSRSYFGRCLGLPEEVRLRQAARRRGYVVMAVSSIGYRRCWDMAKDVDRVKAAVAHVKTAEGLPADAPVLASGASSGGAFMGPLAGVDGLAHLRCIVPQIMGIHEAPNRGVPTLFVHMPKDGRTAVSVARDRKKLKASGVRNDEIEVQPVPVTLDLLRPCLQGDVAEAVLAALASSGVLDDQGFLKDDARHRQWAFPVRKVLSGFPNVEDSLQADESCLSELMNVAWAKHEFTAQYAEDMLDFCEELGTYRRLEGDSSQKAPDEL
eukprot:TRINITY_DN65067_c0_g1_i1.p1 TRINITY_DN65067_c0_g1~~TRINITY_DN65067_c0_g1_i1.p1  ORF type:complete len:393 (-),score=58.99 TRINITY_DN65067_c0_g1_i1:159-1217(-)